MSIPIDDARYEPDWRYTVLFASSQWMMSPGSAGAKMTSAPGPVAVKVFMKKDSPPSTERFRPFMNPPCVLVAMPTVGVIAIMAPASPLADSPWSRWTFAIA